MTPSTIIKFWKTLLNKRLIKKRMYCTTTDQWFSVSTKEQLLKCLLDHCILIGSERLNQSEYSDHLYNLIVVL